MAKTKREKAVELCAELIAGNDGEFNFKRDFPKIKEKFPRLDGRGVRYLVMDAQGKLGLPRRYKSTSAGCNTQLPKKWASAHDCATISKFSRALIGLHAATCRLRNGNEKLVSENKALKDEIDALRIKIASFEGAIAGNIGKPVVEAIREGLRAHKELVGELSVASRG